MKVKNRNTGEVREVLEIARDLRELRGFSFPTTVWVLDDGQRLSLSEMLDWRDEPDVTNVTPKA